MATTREIYDALDLPMLERWVSEQQQEDLRLDFKLLAGHGELAKDDRKNLMKAVSGFANGDGGLIVWGVDCRKNDDGVDAAKELKPVQNAAGVLSQLRDNPSQITSPIVDGVEHKLIAASESGSGFLVTYVPASDRGPHMANDRHYYKRNGTSFLTMEHFDVADMFGRRQRPDVRVHLGYKKIQDASDSDNHKYVLSAELKNHGRARAHDIKIILNLPLVLVPEGYNAPYRDRVERVHFQTQAAFFPGDKRDASFNGLVYRLTYKLYTYYAEHGWPDLTVQIFQDDLAPTIEAFSLLDLSNY